MNHKERKALPVYSGFIKYFPKAIREVTKASVIGNKQHLPGQSLEWDRSKSSDEPDALIRHILDHAEGEIFDTDGVRHLAKAGWRIMAWIEKELENEQERKSSTKQK